MNRLFLLGMSLLAVLFVASADAQVVYRTYYAQPTTVHYAPGPVVNTTYYAPAAPVPSVAYHAPTTTYYAPRTSFYAPTAAPAVVAAPAVTTYYRPILGGGISRFRTGPAPVTYVAPPTVTYYAPY